ncbi:hypothetical protein BX666DRAFT_2120836 [Dichotomocladium elegans]|nr:hypothetical protein BX666DRAFT_2120836 [Dichotomocladium elegans]
MPENHQESKNLSYPRIAIVTGANSGVGYGIIQRILRRDPGIHVVMACRNSERAERSQQQLSLQFPGAHIEIQLVDLANIESVLAFCTRIKTKYTSIHYLFCNAGMMMITGVNYGQMIRVMLTNPAKLMESTDLVIQSKGLLNDDGIGLIFAANVLGHFIMARELENLLDASEDGRVIWTSSMASTSAYLDREDWQGIKSPLPYESSKWAMDLVAIGNNARYKSEKLRIASFSTSPGVLATGIGSCTESEIAIRRVFHYMFRFCGVNSQTINGFQGAISNTHVAFEPLETLDPYCRYYSLSSRLGKSYVQAIKVRDFDPSLAKEFMGLCEDLYLSRIKHIKDVECTFAN